MTRILIASFMFVALSLLGCGGGPSAKVVGRVTCGDKPVKGAVMFSPFGEGSDNTGPAVSADLKEDGSYEIHLKTIGKHRIVVTPSDRVYPAKPGQDYPCDLSPIEKEVKPGDNEITIPLSKRSK
jgi:hypothetical protein